jgi:hypothetical protein
MQKAKPDIAPATGNFPVAPPTVPSDDRKCDEWTSAQSRHRLAGHCGILAPLPWLDRHSPKPKCVNHFSKNLVSRLNRPHKEIRKANVLGVERNGAVGGTPRGSESLRCFHKGGWEPSDTGGWKISGAKLLALQAIGEVVYITSGQANADAATFAQDAKSYAIHNQEGDGALADMDAAMIAIDMFNLTGNDNFGLSAWAGL